MLATQPPIPRPPQGGSAILPQSKINNQQSPFINPICRFGQIVLLQFNSIGDPENGGRFTVKKYHSERLGARLHRSCQIDFPLAFGQQYSKLAP